MRVGLVVYGSLSETTGGFLYDRNLVHHLRNAGETVDVIELPWRSYPRHLLDNFDAEVSQRLKAAEVDVLLQDELCHPSLVRLNRRVPADVPIVTVVHHLRSSEPGSAPLTWFYRLVERRYLQTVDGVIATSHTTRSTVEDLATIDRSTVVQPGTGRFDSDLDRHDVATRANEAGPLRVLFLGSLIPRKGVDTLLDALARLPHDEWRCTVIGDDAVDPRYAESLREQVADLGIGERVRFTGSLGRGELSGALSNGHVLSIPSRYEGFGIAYLEGMGFGLPPVATTAGGASELVSDGVNGWLIPPDDVDAIERALRPLLDDRERLARRGQAALNRYESHPSWEETMERAHAFLLETAEV